MSDRFKKWCLDYSGCDGGDFSSKDSIWVCGIEWGGDHKAEKFLKEVEMGLGKMPSGYSHWEENLAYIYNRQIMKLLGAINGGTVEDFAKFAETAKPFVEGQTGYCKLNLYPLGFKNTSNTRWNTEFAELTGFKTKPEYVSWCKANRMPTLRTWAAEKKPKLIICLGKTYRDDFKSAFGDPNIEVHIEFPDPEVNRELAWFKNTDGTLVVMLPFMINRYGLTKNSSIQKFATRISELM